MEIWNVENKLKCGATVKQGNFIDDAHGLSIQLENNVYDGILKNP